MLPLKTDTKEEFDAWVRDKLDKSILLRHLFSKIRKEVTVETTTTRIRGILNSIDLVNKMFEIEATGQPNYNTYYIRWDYVIYLEAPKHEGIK